MSKSLVRWLLVAVIGGAWGAPCPRAQAPAECPRPSKDLLLVLNKSDDTMAIVDPAALRVVATVPTGKGPHEAAVAPGGATAYVSNYGTQAAPGSTLTVVDVRARKAARTIDLGEHRRPHGITVGPDGRIFVTCEGTKALLAVDPSSGKVEKAYNTGQEVTHMVVVTPDGRRAFTANIGSDTVTAIDLDSGAMTQVSVGKGPEGIDVSPDGREVWVAHRGDGGLSIIDAAALKVASTLRAGDTPIRVKFTPDGRSVLVSCMGGNEIAVFDARTREVRARIPAGEAPIGILVAPGGRTAYVAGTRSDKVSVVDLAEGKVTGTISPGKEPDGMAWAAAQGD